MHVKMYVVNNVQVEERCGLHFEAPVWHLVQSYGHTTSNVNRPVKDCFTFDGNSPRQQVRTSGMATGQTTTQLRNPSGS